MAPRRPTNHRDIVIKQAISQLFLLQLAAGTRAKELKEIASACIDTVSEHVQVRTEETDDSDVHTLGSVLRDWHRKAIYLQSNGLPRPLPVGGRNGLRKLVAAHYSPERFPYVFTSLRKSGLIKKNSAGRWFPTGKHAVIPGISRELLAHLAEGVMRYIETVTRNISTSHKDEVLFERSSRVKDFPVALAPSFRGFVNEQAIAFVAAIDDWLEARVEEGSHKKTRKCSAGVFAFAFMDDYASGYSVRRQKRKFVS